MESSRQEYQSGLLFPTPGNLHDPEIEPTYHAPPALAGKFFTAVPPKAYTSLVKFISEYFFLLMLFDPTDGGA